MCLYEGIFSFTLSRRRRIYEGECFLITFDPMNANTSFAHATNEGELALGIVPDFEKKSLFHFCFRHFSLQKEGDVPVFEAERFQPFPGDARCAEMAHLFYHARIKSFFEASSYSLAEDFFLRIESNNQCCVIPTESSSGGILISCVLRFLGKLGMTMESRYLSNGVDDFKGTDQSIGVFRIDSLRPFRIFFLKHIEQPLGGFFFESSSECFVWFHFGECLPREECLYPEMRPAADDREFPSFLDVGNNLFCIAQEV